MTPSAQSEKKVRTLGCPACSCKLAYPVRGRIYRCAKCAGIYGDCYLGESYEFVLPYMSSNPNVPPEETRYFDFTCLGSKGLSRRHGWYEVATKLIVQVG